MDSFIKYGIKLPQGAKGDVKVICPQCTPHQRKPENRNSKDLSVSVEEGVWNCHNCHWKGSLKSKHYVRPEPLAESKINLSDRALEWFKKRGISKHTLQVFKVHSDVQWFPQVGGDATCIAFPYFRNGQFVNCKYRDGQKNFKMIKDAELVFYNLDGIAKEVVIVEGECFSGETEILTPSGWVRFDQYSNQKVAQVNEDGFIEFVNPIAVINKDYSGKMVSMHSKGYSIAGTIGHNFSYVYKGLKKCTYDKIPKYADIPIAGFLNGPGIPLSDMEIRLAIAISADFTIREEGDLYAAFKKERKIMRVKWILDALNIQYSANVSKKNNGYTSIFIKRGNKPHFAFKKFPKSWYELASVRQKHLIIEELLYWDGNSVPNRKQIEYSSKEKENADFIQFVCHTIGFKSTIIKRKSSLGEWYKVSILYSKHFGNYQAIKHDVYDHSGRVYCVQVPSGYIMVRHNDHVSITGNCDALSVYETGYYNVLSVPNGATTGNNKLEYLDNCWRDFEDVETIILATDNDEPGIALRNELARRFGRHRCKFITHPEGCKDMNDCLVNGHDIKKIIAEATPFPVEGILGVNDFIEEVMDIYDNGVKVGDDTGFFELDSHIKWRKGEYTTITGIPGAGKSRFIDQIANRLASKHGWKIAFCSPEKPPALHTGYLISQFSGSNFFSRDERYRMAKEDVNESLWYIQEYFRFYKFSEVDKSVQGIIDKAKELVKSFGLDMLVIDPWNTLDHQYSNGMSETQYISKALDIITTFAKNYDVAVVLVAHPTKVKKENGKFDIPTMYSIQGSSHFFNKTDNGLCVYRDYDTGEVRVYIQKIRNDFVGKLGDVQFHYDKFTGRYSETGDFISDHIYLEKRLTQQI